MQCIGLGCRKPLVLALDSILAAGRLLLLHLWSIKGWIIPIHLGHPLSWFRNFSAQFRSFRICSFSLWGLSTWLINFSFGFFVHEQRDFVPVDGPARVLYFRLWGRQIWLQPVAPRQHLDGLRFIYSRDDADGKFVQCLWDREDGQLIVGVRLRLHGKYCFDAIHAAIWVGV